MLLLLTVISVTGHLLLEPKPSVEEVNPAIH